VKQIVKKRTKFEYALKRRVGLKADYLRSIEYEMNLEELRIRRKEAFGSGSSSKTPSLSLACLPVCWTWSCCCCCCYLELGFEL